MRRHHLPTLVLALCIAALAVYNLALEVQVWQVQQATTAIEATPIREGQTPAKPVDQPVQVDVIDVEPSV